MFENINEVDWKNWQFTEDAVLTFIQDEKEFF